jgi:hypothetical protein
VVGNVSAAIGGVKFDIFLAEDVFGSEKIRAIGVAPESDDVRMLAKQKDVVDGASFTGGNKTLLEGVRLSVGDEA